MLEVKVRHKGVPGGMRAASKHCELELCQHFRSRSLRPEVWECPSDAPPNFRKVPPGGRRARGVSPHLAAMAPRRPRMRRIAENQPLAARRRVGSRWLFERRRVPNSENGSDPETSTRSEHESLDLPGVAPGAVPRGVPEVGNGGWRKNGLRVTAAFACELVPCVSAVLWAR